MILFSLIFINLWCNLLIKFIIKSTINMRGWNTISSYLRSAWEFSNPHYLLLSAFLPCMSVRILIGWENQFSWMRTHTPFFTFIYNIFNPKKKKSSNNEMINANYKCETWELINNIVGLLILCSSELVRDMDYTCSKSTMMIHYFSLSQIFFFSYLHSGLSTLYTLLGCILAFHL